MSPLSGNISYTSTTYFDVSAEDNGTLISQGTINGTGNVTVRDSPIAMSDSASFITFVIYVITSCVAVVGIVGNVMSIIVLKRHGLQKSSFILLISLAVTDTVCLVGLINIPEIIYHYNSLKDLDISPSIYRNLNIWHSFQNFITLIGQFCSFTIPVLITLERLVAVLFPMRLRAIFTVKRTTIAVSVMCLFWVLAVIYLQVMMEISNVRSLSKVDQLSENVIHYVILFIIANLHGTVPVPVVTIGCLIVGIATKVAMIKRARITSSRQTSQSRTTKLLLAVCFIYVIAGGYKLCVQILLLSYDVYTFLLYDIGRLLNCLNSSCNFIIYVLMNKNLRKMYLSLAHAVLPCLKLRLTRANT